LENWLNNASDASASNGTSRSAVSGATVSITDNAQQQVLTGKTAEATVATLNTNTANSQQGVQKYDPEEMRKQVEAAQTVKGAAINTVIKFSDESYRKMFVEKAKMYSVTKDEKGNTVIKELSEQEKMNLKPGTNGKVYVAENGIFNDVDAAAKYALQHATTDAPQYLLHFPKADNAISELMIAGYQKFMEGTTLGLTNATTTTVELMNQYGQSGLHIDAHSRGALTTGNAMEVIQKQDNAVGALSNTTINFFGAAYNAKQADNILGQLQNRNSVLDPSVKSSMVLQMQNHIADPVGGWIGGNPSTGGIIPSESGVLSEMYRAGTGKENTSHNCYGKSESTACGLFWINALPLLKPVSQIGGK
jgi:filamentous hemagglutinin